MPAVPGRAPAAPLERPVRSPARAGLARLVGVLVVVVAGLTLLGGPAPPTPDRTIDPAPSPRPASAPRGEGGGEASAAAKLRRAELAARTVAWAGTQFVGRWADTGESSALLDVLHVPGRGTLVQPAAGGGGSAAFVPEGSPQSPGPPAAVSGRRATQPPLSLLEGHYLLRDVGSGRCAGREADVVEAWRRTDPPVLAARFWLDRATGLVLRREVLDDAGRRVLASGLLDLRVPPGDAEPVIPPTGAATPDVPALDPVDVGRLREEGWVVPAELAGLELHETRAAGGGDDRLVLLAYSDGLVSVSVFMQAGELDEDALDGWQRRQVGTSRVWAGDGVPMTVAWSARGTVFTVIADGPADVLDAAVVRLPHERATGVERGWTELRSRLARGLSRVADWVGPAQA